MLSNTLGRSGLVVSKLSFGSWVSFDTQMAVDQAAECMAAAYDAGCNFFDNAEVYADGRSEEVMGAALAKLGWSRDSYVLSTKLFWGGPGLNQRGLSRKHIVEGTRASLTRLNHEYVDLLFCHRPDVHTPIEETVRAMNHVIDRGWAFYWGTSEWSAEQIREAWRIARENHLIGPLMEQPQYHLFHRERVEREYAALYADFGLGTTTFSPLASGLLTGKYNEGIPEGSRLSLPRFAWLKKRIMSDPEFPAKISAVKQLAYIAAELETTLPQLAIAWCCLNPHVSTVITGASRVEQVRENMAAIELLPRLTPEVQQRIEDIIGNRPQAPTDFRA